MGMTIQKRIEMMEEGAKIEDLQLEPEREGGLLRREGVPFHARSRTSVLGLDAIAKKKRLEREQAEGHLASKNINLDLDRDPLASVPKDPKKLLKWPKGIMADAEQKPDRPIKNEEDNDHQPRSRERARGTDRSRSRSRERKPIPASGKDGRT